MESLIYRRPHLDNVLQLAVHNSTSKIAHDVVLYTVRIEFMLLKNTIGGTVPFDCAAEP